MLKKSKGNKYETLVKTISLIEKHGSDKVDEALCMAFENHNASLQNAGNILMIVSKHTGVAVREIKHSSKRGDRTNALMISIYCLFKYGEISINDIRFVLGGKIQISTLYKLKNRYLKLDDKIPEDHKTIEKANRIINEIKQFKKQ